MFRSPGGTTAMRDHLDSMLGAPILVRNGSFQDGSSVLARAKMENAKFFSLPYAGRRQRHTSCVKT